MGLLELLMVAVGVSMDAFAVSLVKGLRMRKVNYRHAAIIAAFFGGFQAFMPLAGWVAGRQFERYITGFDHWIAFILLAFIGGKMLMEAFRKDAEEPVNHDSLDIRELAVLAVATSIDALAVGIAFAALKVSILPSVVLIGITTFGFSFLGVDLGYRFGMRFKSAAEISGGLVLITIGLKILFEHLGII